MICNIDSLTLAMLKARYQRRGELAVIEYCEKYGLDKDEIISRITGSSLGTAQISTVEVSQVDRINNGYQPKQLDLTSNLAQYYGVKYSNYLDMLKRYKIELVRRVLFDYRVDTRFKDPNKRTKGVTNINNAILAYKLELLNTIKSSFSNLSIDINLDAINAIKDEQFERILQYFWDNKESITDEVLKQRALDAYVILKHFDSLLETNAPFIEVDSRYKTQKAYLSYKYNYVPADVKHYKGSITKNEYASSEETTGEMIKMLLEYIPESYNSKIIENSSIGVAGFDSAMQRVKKWIKTDPDAWEEYKKGDNMDIQQLIQRYLSIYPNEMLQNKLNSIANIIFGKNTNGEFIMTSELRNVLLNRFVKYVSTEYVGYKNSEDDPEQLVQTQLTERDELVARGNLTDAVKGAIVYWSYNKDIFNELIENKNNLNLDALRELFYELTYTFIPEDFDSYVKSLGLLKSSNAILNEIIDYIQSRVDYLIQNPSKQDNIIKDYSDKFYGVITDLAKVFAHIEGTSVRSVIRNQEGNNLPLQQLPCLAYLQKEISDRIDSEKNWTKNTFTYNFVQSNMNRVLSPVIKTSIAYNDSIKSISTCSVSELTHVGFVQDFFAPLITGNSVIGLQSHCYADKTKYFLQKYELENWNFDSENVNLNKLFLGIINGTDFDNSVLKLKEIWRNSLLKQYEQLVNNILDDYSIVFGKEYRSLSEVENLFKNRSFSEIKIAFKNAQIDFIEDVHYSKINKSYTINKTLEELLNIYSSESAFEKFFNEQYAAYKKDMQDNWETIGFDKTLVDYYKDKAPISTNKKWIKLKIADDYGRIRTISRQEDTPYLEIEACPAIMAFFLAHNVLGLNHNRILYGDVSAHPNKESGSDAKNFTVAMASRWVAQTKRLAIAGATYHNLAQGEKYGVEKEVKIAVMNDISANVNNVIGSKDKIDAHDGSGYSHPIYSRMTNASLLDAKVGSGNRKTIFADVSSLYGNASLLKWAEYEITNEKRRNSMNGIDFNELIRKMSSELIPDVLLQNMTNSTYIGSKTNNICFYDINSNKYYKITSVDFDYKDGYLFANRTLQELNENGEPIRTITGQIPIKTIWDLDQLFGGCYCGKFSNNKWIFTETNQDIIYKLVCDASWKSNFIGYIVNKSAIKVGARNINEYDSSEELWTTTISTEFGGIQMDADHELEESESAEPTQMITSLAQDGNSTEQVEYIYNKIAEIALKSISDYVNAENKDQLYNIVKKAIIKAFATGQKDEIGLAQSFIAFAQSDAAEELGYKIPFSSDTINGIFNSTVLSNISKSAIKRKYNGFAGVLNPSYGIMQYYDIDGKKMTYVDVVRMIRSHALYNPNISIANYFTDAMFNSETGWFDNPFVKKLNGQPDFEDTIIIKYKPYTQAVHTVTYENGDTRYYLAGEEINPNFVKDGMYHVKNNIGEPLYLNENGDIVTETHKIVKIDNYDKYIQYRHRNLDIYNFTIAPKNLKGYNITYKTVDVNGIENEFSLYDHPCSIALHQITFDKSLMLKDPSINEFITNADILEYVAKTIKVYGDNATVDNLKTILDKELKAFIQNLKVGNRLNDLTITEINTQPAQIIAGRTNAKEFMLQEGDTIADIKEKGSKFFRERLSGKYNDLNVDKDSYDFVMFDGAGKTLYVTFRQPVERQKLSINDDYQNVGNEGVIFYGEQEICSADDKQFYKYTDNNGTVHDLLVLHPERWQEQLNEIRKTSRWVNARSNFNHLNFDVLYKLKQTKDWNDEKLNGENPYLLYYDEYGKIKRQNFNSNYAILPKSDVLIKMLNDDQLIRQGKYFDKKAERIYNSFIKSLNIVGTRIPCQSMQSFVPMEIVMFCDSTVNEIYLPASVTWVQGSDYDIDKQYLIGFEPSADGEIFTEYEGDNFNLQTMSLKNAIVDSIFKVTTDPNNFINMTTPITIENVGELASKSSKGAESKTLSPNNPISVYKLQVENAVGKTGIGVAATGTKSFLSLTQHYNIEFDKLYQLISNGEYETAFKLLTTLLTVNPTKNKNEIRTLAGVNLNKFTDQFIESILNDGSFGESLKNYLTTLKERQYREPNAILSMGELLNAATDNAKHLYLKKINADPDWMDIYLYNLSIGVSLDTTFKLMQDVEINEFINDYGSNIFSARIQSFNKATAFEQYLIDKFEISRELTKTEIRKQLFERLQLHKNLKSFYYLLKHTEEYRLLGQLTKINQGLPTRKYDLYRYIQNINNSINDIYDLKLFGLDELGNTYDRNGFNIVRFVNDSKYANEAIERAELSRQQKHLSYNALAILNNLPHMKNMWKALTVGLNTMNQLSTKNMYHFVNLADIKHKDESEFNSKIDELNQHLNILWLQSFDFAFKIPKDIYKMIKHVEVDNDQIEYIKGEHSIETFKRYMDLYVIPKLKSLYPDNAFIKALRFGIDKKHNTLYWRLPINMMEVDKNPAIRIIYEQISEGFNELAKVDANGNSIHNFNGNSITNLFYVYNMFTSKGFSQNSMTRLFAEQVTVHNKGAFVVEHAQWLDSKTVYNLDRKTMTVLEELIDIRDSIDPRTLKVGGNWFTIIKVIDEDIETNASNFNVDDISFIRTLLDDKIQGLYTDSNYWPGDVFYVKDKTGKSVKVIVQESNKVATIKTNLENESNPTSEYYYKLDLSESIILNDLIQNDEYYKKHIHFINSENIYKVLSKYGLNKQAIDESSLISTNAFVFNGEVFINTDNATDEDVVHEFAHLFISDLKQSKNENDRNRLINALEKVKQHPLYKELSLNPRYQLLRGDDLAEEVLATLIGQDVDYLHKITDVFKESTNPVEDFINIMLSTSKIGNSYRANVFVKNAKIAQKTTAARNEFIEQGMIKEECN